MSTYPQTLAKPQQIRSALSIYRVLATVAGIALFVLILEMVMKYVFKQTNVLTEYWSPIHGIIYFAYAVSVANLGLKAAWGPVRIVKNLLAGFVPVRPVDRRAAQHRPDRGAAVAGLRRRRRDVVGGALTGPIVLARD